MGGHGPFRGLDAPLALQTLYHENGRTRGATIGRLLRGICRILEHRAGVEPANAGFADLCVSHFATGALPGVSSQTGQGRNSNFANKAHTTSPVPLSRAVTIIGQSSDKMCRFDPAGDRAITNAPDATVQVIWEDRTKDGKRGPKLATTTGGEPAHGEREIELDAAVHRMIILL